MRASFIHIADTHLGYEQYGVRERFNDFSRVFWDTMEEAVHRQVNFVVIAGDLFNKRAIDAQTLIHAIEGLKKLKERRIPVIAIEGNHDRSYYRDGISWLQFLCHQEYLILLAPYMRDGAPVLSRWQPDTMRGSHVDLVGGRLRVYGLPWQGAATNRSMEGLAEAMAAARAEEEVAHRQRHHLHLARRLLEEALDLARQLRADPLVGVDLQRPVAARGLQRGVAGLLDHPPGRVAGGLVVVYDEDDLVLVRIHALPPIMP